MSRSQRVFSTLRKVARPSETVNLSGLLRYRSGPMKSFQALMKVKIATVTIAGTAKGTMMRE